jgi:hypothetical protein
MFTLHRDLEMFAHTTEFSSSAEPAGKKKGERRKMSNPIDTNVIATICTKVAESIPGTVHAEMAKAILCTDDLELKNKRFVSLMQLIDDARDEQPAPAHELQQT